MYFYKNYVIKTYLEYNNINKAILKIFLFFSFVTITLYLKGDYFYFDSDITKGSIKVGFWINSIKYGGRERAIAILLNYLAKETYFTFYLITSLGILEDEYFIPTNIKRISLRIKKMNIFKVIEEENLDIIVYNSYGKKEIKKLNKLQKTKIIYYDHSVFLFWILFGNNFYNSIYQSYKKCKYVISLVPLENDYLFKRWGINSILMYNPQTFEYDLVKPSDLSSKNIIMIGRTDDVFKRFDLGIKAMKFIIKEIPECKLNIIGSYNEPLERLIKRFHLENFIQFTGFHINIEKYLKSSSLHIFTSIAEAQPMVLSETKIFGIPTILCGLDYLALAKGGNVIIYDDSPKTIAKEAIKILKDDKFRKKLGKEARKSMKKIRNNLIAKKWVKLLLSIYKDNNNLYTKLVSEDNKNKMKKKEAEIILNNQLQLWTKRIHFFRNTNLDKVKSFFT